MFSITDPMPFVGAVETTWSSLARRPSFSLNATMSWALTQLSTMVALHVLPLNMLHGARGKRDSRRHGNLVVTPPHEMEKLMIHNTGHRATLTIFVLIALAALLGGADSAMAQLPPSKRTTPIAPGVPVPPAAPNAATPAPAEPAIADVAGFRSARFGMT